MTETHLYYDENARAFVENTLMADMTETQDKFLSYLPKKAHILDAGCGSGRDSLSFIKQGYKVTAIDASSVLCQYASKVIGQEVKNQYFQEIDDKDVYDGIWACATLLHVSSEEIKDVLVRLRNALKQDGYLYASFKEGEFEGMRNGRYFVDYTDSKLIEIVEEVGGFEVVNLWYTEDVRVDRTEKWVNIIMAKRVND